MQEKSSGGKQPGNDKKAKYEAQSKTYRQEETGWMQFERIWFFLAVGPQVTGWRYEQN